MTTVLEIEEAIRKLPEDEYSQFRPWLEDYELEQDLLTASAQIAQLLNEEDATGSQLLDP